MAIETYGRDQCLKCIAKWEAQAVAYKNGQTANLEDRAATYSMHLRYDHAEVLRLLRDETESWRWFRAEVREGSAEIRAGNQSEGEERIVDAAADLGRLMTACILDELTQEAA